MRLTAEQRSAIVEETAHAFGPTASVRLFGSRVDDQGVATRWRDPRGSFPCQSQPKRSGARDGLLVNVRLSV